MSSGKVSSIFITSWHDVKGCQFTNISRRLLISSFTVLLLFYYNTWWHRCHHVPFILLFTFLELQLHLKYMKGRWLFIPSSFQMASISSPVLLFSERWTIFPLIIIIFSLSGSLPDICVLLSHTLHTPLYVSPASLPVWVPWNYVCVVHGPLPGLYIYTAVLVGVPSVSSPRLSTLFINGMCSKGLPQLAGPRSNGTCIIRLGTCLFLILIILFYLT